MFYKTYKKTKKTGKYSGIYLDVPQKVILSFFNWALPKPIHFFCLIKKSKQKKSRLHFIFSS